MARIGMIPDAALSADQAAAVSEVVSGPRGKVPAPMIAWLRNAELARRLQRLGELLRYDTELGPLLTELAVLVSARHWTSHVEWKAHKTYALQAGLDPAFIAAIAARREPIFSDERACVVYEVSSALLTAGRLQTPLYQRATELLGERALVELVALMGYYTLASFTLNTFELGLPASAVAELEDPEFPGAGT